MSATTSISWTNKTLNPTRGCRLKSPGCEGCYAMGQAHRYSGPGMPFEGLTKLRAHGGPVWTGSVRLVPDALEEALGWRGAFECFVDSMSDLFIEDVPFEFIAAFLAVAAVKRAITFQILTKRPERLGPFFAWLREQSSTHGFANVLFNNLRAVNPAAADRVGRRLHDTLGSDYRVIPNVWLGASVENHQYAVERIPLLCSDDVDASIRFLSYEPALGPIDWHDLPITDESIDWLIVGGESGPKARPFNIQWAYDCLDLLESTPVFVKQLGKRPFEVVKEVSLPRRLKDAKGEDMNEWPEGLRHREMPCTGCHGRGNLCRTCGAPRLGDSSLCSHRSDTLTCATCNGTGRVRK